MKVSELRIGNYITDEFYDSFKTILKVESINEKGVNDLTECNGRLAAIPLTEDWLLKFGFEKEYSNYIIEAGDYFHSIKKDGEEWIYSYDESDACCYELRSIKYIHQLQNLYFALNDKEL